VRENAADTDGSDAIGISGSAGGSDGQHVAEAGPAFALECADEQGGSLMKNHVARYREQLDDHLPDSHK
jgi:hypothetical protein